MLFRTILVPFIRIFQWSGLSPFPVFAKGPKLLWRTETFRFTVITGVILLINFASGIYSLRLAIRFLQLSMGNIKLLAYTHMLAGLIVRINVITVLIESFARRSTQAKLLATFDETENIFREKLNVESEKHQLRTRFRTFIIICVIKNATLAVLIVSGFIVTFKFEWLKLYASITIFLQYYTSYLFYAQWMMYVDVVRFNVERVNECLMKISTVERIDRFPMNRPIVQVEPISFHMFDACERLAYLRKCYRQIWQASLLINRCFYWSLFSNISADLYLLVENLYLVLCSMVTLIFGSLYFTVFSATLIGIILSRFSLISMICENINAEVSCDFSFVSSPNYPMQNQFLDGKNPVPGPSTLPRRSTRPYPGNGE